MQTRVVNLNDCDFDVYIGRPGKNQDGYFGNPCLCDNRSKSIADFKVYFYKRLSSDPEFKYRIHQLRGKTLGCFCKPQRCHGDIIVKYLNDLPETVPIKLGVVGSRSFTDYSFMCGILKWYDIEMIVSGGATGADSLAIKYAVEHNLPYKEFLPDWNLYGKRAGYLRNELIIHNSDEVIAFWDGKSKGTKHSIDIAESLGKPIHLYWPKEEDIDDLLTKLSVG